ncbi:hypothetical protein A7U60_g4076 [Sanghuangporus baumii]|uniref:Uncharacterized protein n=1 Tax=Sanghuangporus baumii TaxID=108892 RepID=A0A9Q5N9J9_SANBA|nr:hypothetical protein A7U60_g4076 [Sanghuangporus baumii]
MSHPQLMREIIPMSVLHKYRKKENRKKENFEDLVKAKNYKLRHNNAPAFLYDKELWDPDNPDIGLFKGHFPILVLCQILFSLKAATSASGSQMTGTHRNNTEISGHSYSKNFGPADDQDIEDDEDEDDETCFTNIVALQRAWKAQQSA